MLFRSINPKVDAVTRTVAARARIANPDGKLRPGIFARVLLPLPNAQTSLVVPETTLVPSGSKVFAYRIKEGVAEQVEVRMGQRNNGMIEVPSRLNEGDTVIVTGQMRVQDGKPVNVVKTLAAPVNVPLADVSSDALSMQPAVSAPALQDVLQDSAQPKADAPATVTLQPEPTTSTAGE